MSSIAADDAADCKLETARPSAASTAATLGNLWQGGVPASDGAPSTPGTSEGRPSLFSVPPEFQAPATPSTTGRPSNIRALPEVGEHVESPAPSTPAARRGGLSSEEAANLLEQWGTNEIPKIETPMWKMVLQQFTGLMPFMLEVSCVVSAVATDWLDFGVIAGMLVINAGLGLREELKAKRALDELTNSLESSVPCLRDGVPKVLGVTKLVPGDVIHMRGGTLTPADVEWMEGDVLSIDTAALTGEPIPRKYPSQEHGRLILAGTTVKSGEAYCVVRDTGVRTEMGRGQADIASDRASASVSVFERKVMVVVNVIIFLAVLDTLCLILVQGIGRNGFQGAALKQTLLVALSILIAAVPVALPLVLQVTMAIGAYRMATCHSAIVTRMSALQDIASMDVLCSDKTGTLTTAKMSINLDMIWPAAEAGFELLGLRSEKVGNELRRAKQQMLLTMALMCSNVDKKDDAIDGALLRAVDKMNAEQGGVVAATAKRFKQLQLSGFNPEVKRTVAAVLELAEGRKLVVAKGLATKILDTTSGGADCGELQWCCEECSAVPNFRETVKLEDSRLASAGYKTLAVAVGVEGGPMHFLGLLPMIDPPRNDTAKTVRHILDAGVEIKMITGDHLNIAIETARLVGMPVNIMPGELTREGSFSRDELVRGAGGFAEVLPRDKRECVLVLQRAYNLVVGMTGDGVNDAPALSAAQCGIAVDDATDAAKGAAAMILTTEGLSAVFGAIVESRKIFNRLFSYITYRLASTIQILLYLSILVYAFDCRLNPTYVILLALFNDITMIPVAEDRQTASAEPQHARVGNLIGFSVLLGLVQSIASIVYFLGMYDLHLVENLESRGYLHQQAKTPTHVQNAIWLQVSIAAELLIFAARAPGLFFLSRPSIQLFCSAMLGNVISTLLAVYAFPDGLKWEEVGIIWAYDIGALFIVDLAKLCYKCAFEYNAAGIIDEKKLALEDAVPEIRVVSPAQGSGNARDVEALAAPLTGTQGTPHGSFARAPGLMTSVSDLLRTGKSPYRHSPGTKSSASAGSLADATSFGASLHPRTPGLLAYQSYQSSVHQEHPARSRPGTPARRSGNGQDERIGGA